MEPLSLSEVTILTPRLKLIPISDKYCPDIFTEFTQDIARYMVPTPAQNLQQVQGVVSSGIRLLQAGTDLGLIILDKQTEEFIGMAGLHRLTTSTPEIGIWIKKSQHGQGLGRQAVSAIKSWADSCLHYKYLIYPVDKRNLASRKIVESLGGKIASEQLKTKSDGQVLDEVVYHIYRQ